jgi:hypothetical protein
MRTGGRQSNGFAGTLDEIQQTFRDGVAGLRRFILRLRRANSPGDRRALTAPNDRGERIDRLLPPAHARDPR